MKRSFRILRIYFENSGYNRFDLIPFLDHGDKRSAHDLVYCWGAWKIVIQDTFFNKQLGKSSLVQRMIKKSCK